MQFTPKTEKELKSQNLLPAGEYDFEIVIAEAAVAGEQSKNPGLKYIKLTVRVFTENGAFRLVNSKLHPAMEFLLYQFCNETGLADKYELGQLTPKDCVGMVGKLELKITPEDGNFPAKNEVKRWGSKTAKTPKVAPQKAAQVNPSVVGDDVPF